ARVRVQTEATWGADGIDPIKEDEGAQQLAQIRWAHQARYRSVQMAASAKHDLARGACSTRRWGKGHEPLLRLGKCIDRVNVISRQRQRLERLAGLHPSMDD